MTYTQEEVSSLSGAMPPPSFSSGISLQSPGLPGALHRSVGARLAASHVNMLITNSVVLVPIFSSSTDAAAVEVVASVFPDRCRQALPSSFLFLIGCCRRVQGLMARELVLGGGNIHCLSQQEPVA
jgi:agmatine deiminase